MRFAASASGALLGDLLDRRLPDEEGGGERQDDDQDAQGLKGQAPLLSRHTTSRYDSSDALYADLSGYSGRLLGERRKGGTPFPVMRLREGAVECAEEGRNNFV